ncbi:MULTISPECIES: hypothetical protein [Bacillus]|uniref:Uncharacterized protein n=1 Tax=Bacillus glycinifermentans TaxID=1664069 RepID=A0ABU6HB58_9BACI|nr:MULTISPECIES: hypothetical protein [Bacillus]MEC0341930.1 hypothetical protein [Bacillus sonorensis]MEC0457384.1 hypothetical protein [Bacillus sonorensis]MEC0487900.1 hypothetical protein [Bacillus glycinifermentans]MEC0530649.1 hypothetical protein [Bacillus sonorensis]UBF35261.1 hypothetical protein K9N56_24045 [Bacillus sp. PM8313]
MEDREGFNEKSIDTRRFLVPSDVDSFSQAKFGNYFFSTGRLVSVIAMMLFVILVFIFKLVNGDVSGAFKFLGIAVLIIGIVSYFFIFKLSYWKKPLSEWLTNKDSTPYAIWRIADITETEYGAEAVNELQSGGRVTSFVVVQIKYGSLGGYGDLVEADKIFVDEMTRWHEELLKNKYEFIRIERDAEEGYKEKFNTLFSHTTTFQEKEQQDIYAYWIRSMNDAAEKGSRIPMITYVIYKEGIYKEGEFAESIHNMLKGFFNNKMFSKKTVLKREDAVREVIGEHLGVDVLRVQPSGMKRVRLEDYLAVREVLDEDGNEIFVDLLEEIEDSKDEKMLYANQTRHNDNPDEIDLELEVYEEEEDDDLSEEQTISTAEKR